ncbi:hypothetical protein L6452_06077 [Arctium lappa]|uniref:Uncharacterized protein n=1 Tax=Arctium lappa TaxID=4217 RepID=A0ACB9EI45_ARCLA|nr:hypothetical protein L6452_06077 [Arctium lappa]
MELPPLRIFLYRHVTALLTILFLLLSAAQIVHEIRERQIGARVASRLSDEFMSSSPLFSLLGSALFCFFDCCPN